MEHHDYYIKFQESNLNPIIDDGNYGQMIERGNPGDRAINLSSGLDISVAGPPITGPLSHVLYVEPINIPKGRSIIRVDLDTTFILPIIAFNPTKNTDTFKCAAVLEIGAPQGGMGKLRAAGAALAPNYAVSGIQFSNDSVTMIRGARLNAPFVTAPNVLPIYSQNDLITLQNGDPGVFHLSLSLVNDQGPDNTAKGLPSAALLEMGGTYVGQGKDWHEPQYPWNSWSSNTFEKGNLSTKPTPGMSLVHTISSIGVGVVIAAGDATFSARFDYFRARVHFGYLGN
jgi:hypothetical protein